MTNDLNSLKPYLIKHLKLWKDEGMDAPTNELQSIQCWLSCLCQHGAEETIRRMRSRIILLGNAANRLHNEGREAEEAAGIYANRPDLRPDIKE